MMPKRNGIQVQKSVPTIVSNSSVSQEFASEYGGRNLRRSLLAGVLLGVAAGASAQGQSTVAANTPQRTRIVGQLPGLESFAVQPESPLELINAIDYLVRVGLENQAVPLAQKLAQGEEDDETLYSLGQNVGSSKLLALQSTSDASLNSAMERFVAKVSEASKRVAQDPERVERLIERLSASPEERDIAVGRLARLGVAAVDPLIAALSEEGVTPERRSKLQYALNRLETSAVPGLVGALRHPDPMIRASMAEALGEIDDPRALPWLVFESSRKDTPAAFAQTAVVSLNGGRPVSDATRFLTQEASKYLDRDVLFVDPYVEAWFWNNEQKKLSAVTLPSDVARGAIGYRLARMALETNPTDPAAQAIAISMLLDEESRRLGEAFPESDPLGIWPTVLASGPETLANVLSRAMLTERHENVAILATRALGQVVTEPDLSAPNGFSHAIVRAIDSPDRRVQFEAARAISELSPSRPFAGSSRVVPALARFLRANPLVPRAVVIHDNVGKGGDWASYLKNAGYDAVLETSAIGGFEEAAIRADVELVLISTFLDPAGWALHETVANFKADSRTAGIPLIVVGSLDTKSRLATLLGQRNNVGYMIDPVNQDWADRQLSLRLANRHQTPLTAQERESYRAAAAESLGRLLHSDQDSPLKPSIRALEPYLLGQLSETKTQPNVPLSESERSSLIASVVAETAPAADRIRDAERLAADFRTFGAKLNADQKKRVRETFLTLENGKDTKLAESVGRLVGMSSPTVSEVAETLTKFAPGPAFYEAMRSNR